VSSPYDINPNPRYFNFGGKLAPVPRETEPVRLPCETRLTHPKLVTDTTLRDGAQDPCFALFPNEAKLRYFDLLHQLDNGTGAIDSVEVFIYQKRDLWVLEQLLDRGYDYPRVTTWLRATPKDVKELVTVANGRVKETGLLAPCSDHQILDRQGYRSKEEAADKYATAILGVFARGLTPRVHLEDATRADVEGWVIPFMRRLVNETEGRVLFRVCDTVGLGSPDPYASLPLGIPRLVATLSDAVEAELEFHGHNDFGLATANTMAALRYGCRRANCAFGGLGERTGNTPLEQVIAGYVREYGDPGFDLEALGEMAALIEKEVVPLNPKQPLVGSGIFRTQAGLHQTGVAQQADAPGGLIYLPFAPSILGREEEELHRIGGLSGMDGIVSVLNHHVNGSGTSGGRPPLTRTSRAAKYVYDRVQQAYDGRYDLDARRHVDYRTSFFEPEELARLADDYRLREENEE
jgi:isopropylmalate/homocitrate/citramalate synthase